MGYRLLVDEDVHAATAAVLGDRGHDAVSVRTALDSGAPDAAVVAYALRTDRLVVTHDADYLRPSMPDDLRVCYVPRDTMGPGALVDRIEQLSDHVPSQSDLPRVTFLSG